MKALTPSPASPNPETGTINTSKRGFIKHGLGLAAGSALIGAHPALTHNPSKKPLPKSGRNPHGLIIGHGDFRYKVNYLWGNLDPNTIPVENCHGLAIDSKERIIMVTDSDKNNFIIYNKDGKLLDVWGTQYPGAHSVKIAHENGEDFIYIVDCGWVLNRHWDGVSKPGKWYPQSGFISKLTLEGKLVFTIGHPQTMGAYKAGNKFQPTDICIAPNGDLYVTDGYGSDFVLHYDSAGRFIRKFGGKSNSNTDLNLSNTHGIGVDLRNKNDPHLIVSSRAENALKMFEMDGRYRSTLNIPGAYIGGPIFKGEHAYAPVCWSHIDGKMIPNSGFLSILDKDNHVISNPGGTEPEYINGKLQPMQTTWDVFNHCHAVCVDRDDNLYVGQWNANQTYPIKLERVV